MNYNEAIEFIHSVSNYFCKPGLGRITELCQMLGNPQDKLRFVHVAGTNGKGSFCAFLSSILKNAGYKVGIYTSPYILEFNERISINGESISNADLAEICTQVKAFCEQMADKPTEFELITAIAFEYFKRQKCDIVVLECGLGGKLDATNIIKTPELSVITGVDFDHENFLGNTIESIAGEKAGIIKNNIPCLWCGENNDAFSVIKNVATTKNAPITTVNHGGINCISTLLSGTLFNFKNYKDLFIPLLGSYQPKNAVNAITAAEILKQRGFNIKDIDIYAGLKNTSWKARFELLCQDPVIIFDGSHNPQGILAAVNSIKEYFGENKVNILSGVMADKDYKFMAKAIGGVSGNVYCVTVNNPRALKATDYAAVFKESGINAVPFASINDALKEAVCNSKTNKVPLICLGSLYMYADIYKILKEQ